MRPRQTSPQIAVTWKNCSIQVIGSQPDTSFGLTCFPDLRDSVFVCCYVFTKNIFSQIESIFQSIQMHFKNEFEHIWLQMGIFSGGQMYQFNSGQGLLALLISGCSQDLELKF